MSARLAFPPAWARAIHGWSRLGLDMRYAIASLPVLVVAMLSLGWWVTRSIEEQVVFNTAVNASVFVNSFVSPELQGLASRPELTDEESQRLSQMLTDTPLGRRILSFKIWMPGGRMVFYSLRPPTSRRFEPTHNLMQAWEGNVVADLSPFEDVEALEEKRLGVPLLEVYMPVRDRASDRVIAVAEFYQDATQLEARVARARGRTWLAVASVMLVMYGLLFGIVHAGGRLIREQAAQLREKVDTLSALVVHNETLRARVERAGRRATERNEAFLRRLSADLHDGPAQALSLALLRLDHVAAPAHQAPGDGTGTVAPGGSEVESIRNTLQEALREIRELSRGFSLPELAGLDVGRVVERAAVAHQRRTGTPVEVDVAGLGDVDAAMPIKLTAYRFTQEALMNAFRHAEGRGQAVSARRADDTLELRVSDRGPGMRADIEEQPGNGLGLSGLRERVEILGGRFQVEAQPGQGTTLLAVLPLE
ncbi:MAG: sensor histidine kinase [Betaproteobacteria bacterium]